MLGQYIYFISITLSLLTGFVVGVKNYKKSSNILYIFTSLSYIALSTANYFSTISPDNTILILVRLVMFLSALSMMLTFFLIISISRDYGLVKPKLTLKNKVFWSIVSFAIFLNLTPLVVNQVVVYEGHIQKIITGPLIGVFVVTMSYLAIRITFELVNKIFINKSARGYRLQYVYFLIGLMPTFVLAPVTGIILPLMYSNFSLIILTPVYSAFFVIMVGYMMLRHQLFDIRPLFARFLAFLLLVGLSASILIIFSFSLAFFVSGAQNISPKIIIIFSLVSFLAAIILQPLRASITKHTNRFFYQDAYDPQQILNELNASLVSSAEIKDLLNSANTILAKHIRPVFCGIIIDGEKEDFFNAGLDISNLKADQLLQIIKLRNSKSFVIDQLDSDDNDLKFLFKELQIFLVTKLLVQDKLVGLAVFGDRKGGNSYSQKDLQLIETAADSIAIAAQNALRYEEIAAFNINLQKKIEVATHDLQKSNDKLKALDEAKDEFISMASHQLRTPLTSVKGYVSMVLEEDTGKINNQQRKFLNQAFVSSQRMVYLISDLLNVSRLKTGKFVIENKPTYLPDVVEQEIAQLEETVKARGLTMNYDKPANFPTLNIDEEKIRQVIMNFADNSIYYTPTNGVINIGLKATGQSIEYTVTDNGIGVPKSEQPHLFSKFYRAGNARKARPDGTGLGLFMAKKVITAQGGAIIFHSTEGKGSTFGFSLPRQKVEVHGKIDT